MAEILQKFLVRRARVRDDSGRSLHFELDLERSFDSTLSRQPVCEQTSGVLRHTERVQDDKVQKQDWTQSLEKKFCVPPARPRSGKPQAQTARTQRFTAQYKPTNR